MQIMQDKCFRIYLRLNNIHHIPEEDFKAISSSATSKRFNQCIITMTFKFVINTCPYYLKEIFEFASLCRTEERHL